MNGLRFVPNYCAGVTTHELRPWAVAKLPILGSLQELDRSRHFACLKTHTRDRYWPAPIGDAQATPEGFLAWLQEASPRFEFFTKCHDTSQLSQAERSALVRLINWTKSELDLLADHLSDPGPDLEKIEQFKEQFPRGTPFGTIPDDWLPYRRLAILLDRVAETRLMDFVPPDVVPRFYRNTLIGKTAKWGLVYVADFDAAPECSLEEEAQFPACAQAMSDACQAYADFRPMALRTKGVSSIDTLVHGADTVRASFTAAGPRMHLHGWVSPEQAHVDLEGCLLALQDRLAADAQADRFPAVKIDRAPNNHAPDALPANMRVPGSTRRKKASEGYVYTRYLKEWPTHVPEAMSLGAAVMERLSQGLKERQLKAGPASAARVQSLEAAVVQPTLPIGTKLRAPAMAEALRKFYVKGHADTLRYVLASVFRQAGLEEETAAHVLSYGLSYDYYDALTHCRNVRDQLARGGHIPTYKAVKKRRGNYLPESFGVAGLHALSEAMAQDFGLPLEEARRRIRGDYFDPHEEEATSEPELSDEGPQDPHDPSPPAGRPFVLEPEPEATTTPSPSAPTAATSSAPAPDNSKKKPALRIDFLRQITREEEVTTPVPYRSKRAPLKHEIGTMAWRPKARPVHKRVEAAMTCGRMEARGKLREPKEGMAPELKKVLLCEGRWCPNCAARTATRFGQWADQKWVGLRLCVADLRFESLEACRKLRNRIFRHTGAPPTLLQLEKDCRTWRMLLVCKEDDVAMKTAVSSAQSAYNHQPAQELSPLETIQLIQELITQPSRIMLQFQEERNPVGAALYVRSTLGRVTMPKRSTSSTLPWPSQSMIDKVTREARASEGQAGPPDDYVWSLWDRQSKKCLRGGLPFMPTLSTAIKLAKEHGWAPFEQATERVEDHLPARPEQTLVFS